MPCIMKAWLCSVKGLDGEGIEHARTAASARYRTLRRVRDCHADVRITDIWARRARDHDFELPDEHPLVAQLSPEERRIILHAFGYASHLRPTDWGYRDHYCAAPSSRILERLVELGLFTAPRGETLGHLTPIWSGAFFYLTDLGKLIARSMIPLYGEEPIESPPAAATTAITTAA